MKYKNLGSLSATSCARHSLFAVSRAYLCFDILLLFSLLKRTHVCHAGRPHYQVPFGAVRGMHPVAIAAMGGFGLMAVFAAIAMWELRQQRRAFEESAYHSGHSSHAEYMQNAPSEPNPDDSQDRCTPNLFISSACFDAAADPQGP